MPKIWTHHRYHDIRGRCDTLHYLCGPWRIKTLTFIKVLTLSQSYSVDLQPVTARPDLELLVCGDKVSLSWPQLMEVTPLVAPEAALTSEDEQSAGHLQPPQPGLALRPQLDRGQLELLDRWGEAEVTLTVSLRADHGAGGWLEVDNLGEDVGVRELGGEVGHILVMHEAAEENIIPTGQDLV